MPIDITYWTIPMLSREYALLGTVLTLVMTGLSPCSLMPFIHVSATIAQHTTLSSQMSCHLAFCALLGLVCLKLGHLLCNQNSLVISPNVHPRYSHMVGTQACLQVLFALIPIELSHPSKDPSPIGYQ